MEPVAHATLEDDVGHRHHRHTLVVGHVVPDHRVALALGHALRREVDGVVVSVAAERPHAAQALQVFDGLARRELRSEQGGVRGDDGVEGKTALEAEARHAEIGVLIGHLAVARIVRGFGDAPRNALRAAVADLLADDEVVGLVEDAALRLLHDQRRHQVFEHRARPRNQRPAEADLDDGPAETEPVLGRNVALGDGEEAGEAGFRGEQVVTALVELMLLHPVADRHQLAVAP